MSDSSASYEAEEDKENSIHEEVDEREVDIEITSPPSSRQQNLLNQNEDTSTTTPIRRKRYVNGVSRRSALRDASGIQLDKYLELYGEVVDDLLDGLEHVPGSRLSQSQYGVVKWSPDEKSAFFTALACKGKDSATDIAVRIGTKSPLEVRHYLNILRRNHDLRNITDRPGNFVLSKIPAAFEISGKCCGALEKVAKVVRLREEQSHNATGRRRYGRFWIVDYGTALWVEEELELDKGSEAEEVSRFLPRSELESEGLGNPEPEPQSESEASDLSQDPHETNLHAHSIYATAQLLKISMWVELSQSVFMNSGQAKFKDNWTQFGYLDEVPGLTCEAFSDFYALTVSITRRIVQSSIFTCLSRIRSIERCGVKVKETVKKEDVLAALDILKMRHHAQKFWVSVARRCALDVRHNRPKGEGGTRVLDYDEVEQLLSTEEFDDTILETRPSSPVTSVISTSSGSDSDENGSLEGDALSDPEEIHADLLDQRASREEETRIWQSIDRPVPEFLQPINSEDPVEITTPKIKKKRKMPQDMVDWRSRLVYQAEWETFGRNTTSVDEDMGGPKDYKRRKLTQINVSRQPSLKRESEAG